VGQILLSFLQRPLESGGHEAALERDAQSRRRGKKKQTRRYTDVQICVGPLVHPRKDKKELHPESNGEKATQRYQTSE